MVFLAGFRPFDTESDVFEKLNDYLTGHGHETYFHPDRYRQDKLVALVWTAVHVAEYPVQYATVEIEWEVRRHRGSAQAVGKDVFRFGWMDTVDPMFDVAQSRRRDDSFPSDFTPTVGLHQDDSHPDLGANNWQVESPGGGEPDRHTVPYTLVGEDPTTILDYFLRTAPQKLNEARDRHGP